MEIGENWEKIVKIANRSFDSSYHFSMATINSNGMPHITPIGSLILGNDKKGIYFEKYPINLPKNIENNRNVCILGVNTNIFSILKALLKKKFADEPGIRLWGIAGEKRKATKEEIELLHKKIQSLLPLIGPLLSKLKGYKLLWGDLKYVREIQFHSFEPVKFGEMTKSLWHK